MSGSERSALKMRQVLPSILMGAVASCASAIAYSNSAREMPLVANVTVSTICLPVIPGYILSAYISNNFHDANLILAGNINFGIYSSLLLWLTTRRRRKQHKKRESGPV
jgi:hypothetical protein